MLPSVYIDARGFLLHLRTVECSPFILSIFIPLPLELSISNLHHLDDIGLLLNYL